jgi:hypothetical protein
MSHELWIAAGLSITISLGTGLLVRPIHNWLDAKGQTLVQRRKGRSKAAYEMVLFFLGNPVEFQEWLLNAAIRGLLGVIFLMMGGFLAVVILVGVLQLHLLHQNVPLALSDKESFGVGVLLGMLSSFMGGFYPSVVVEAITTYNRVRLPMTFFDKTPETIRNRELEKQAVIRRGYWSPFTGSENKLTS